MVNVMIDTPRGPGNATVEDLQAWAEAHGLTFTIMGDVDKQTWTTYGAQPVPVYLVMDREMVIQYKGSNIDAVIAKVAELMANPPVTPTKTLTPTPTESPGTLTLTFDGAQGSVGGCFTQGDAFYLDLYVNNNGGAQTVELYVLLDVFGQYWSYPSWQSVTVGLDHVDLNLAAGENKMQVIIPQFTMPAVSSIDGLWFYAAGFTAGYLDLDHLLGADTWQFCLR